MPKGIVHCLCEKPRVPVVLTHPAPDDLPPQTTYKAVFKKEVPLTYKPTDAEQQLYYFTVGRSAFSDSGKEWRATFDHDGSSELWNIQSFDDSNDTSTTRSKLMKYEFDSYRDIDGSLSADFPIGTFLTLWEIHELN